MQLKKTAFVLSFAAYAATAYVLHPHDAPNRQQILEQNIRAQNLVRQVPGLSKATIQGRDGKHLVVHVPMTRLTRSYQIADRSSQFYDAARELFVCVPAVRGCKDRIESWISVASKDAGEWAYHNGFDQATMHVFNEEVRTGKMICSYERSQIDLVRDMLRAPKPH